jgi:ribonuclease Z
VSDKKERQDTCRKRSVHQQNFIVCEITKEFMKENAMKNPKISRREFLKLQGLAAGGLALIGSSVYRAAAAAESCPTNTCFDEVNDPAQKNSLFANLDPCCPAEPLEEGEMRITFLGTSCTPMLTQQGVSVFVEVGPTNQYGQPLDYAMFDCGMGCHANYIAARIPYNRMDKIFIAHLHADHMSDLSRPLFYSGDASPCFMGLSKSTL